MTAEEQRVFDEEYMPYVIKWGKIICWLVIPCIFIPALVLIFYFGAKPTIEGIVAGFIPLATSMVVWYVVDPVTLYPILHIPGMFITYVSGNSKEIRAPAATSALLSAEVEAGTPEGTIISAIGISTSVFISMSVMTIIAVVGNVILQKLPTEVVDALGYLLPALFGAMMVQRIMLDYKTAAIVIPLVALLRVLTVKGVFSGLPAGGGYAQIILAVVIGVFVAQKVNKAKIDEK